VGMRGLQRPAPHVQPNVRNWGRRSYKKGDKTGLCGSRWMEMQVTQTRSVEFLHSKKPVVQIEIRRFIGAFHEIYVWFKII